MYKQLFILCFVINITFSSSISDDSRDKGYNVNDNILSPEQKAYIQSMRNRRIKT